jgi:tetratricopeptide (TPR) repeat protein
VLLALTGLEAAGAEPADHHRAAALAGDWAWWHWLARLAPIRQTPRTIYPEPPAAMAQQHPFWTSTDFWAIVASAAGAAAVIGGFLRWVVSTTRQRRGQRVGPRRRLWLLGRRGPAIANDWPARTPRFTGRSQLLADLRGRLRRGRPVVLYGLGGVGKTQAALAYLAGHQRGYDTVWWVRAEQPATLAGDYARLAHALNLPERGDPDQGVVVGAVRTWLRGQRRWLLVFDNATTDRSLARLLPDPLRGQVLVTSRNQLWPDAEVVWVQPWSLAESLAFLDRSLPAPSTDSPSNEQDRQALATELGHLPIALAQAAAFLKNTGWPLARYMAQLRSEPGKLLDLRGLADDERTVAKTWAVALDQLREIPGAEELLTVCAFVAPDDIPRTLLVKGAEVLPELLRQVVGDQVAYEQAVLTLRRYSFVIATAETLTVHRLVQAVVRHRLTEAQAAVWAGTAVRSVAGLFPSNSGEVSAWPLCELLLPHALAAADHAERHHAQPEATGWLLDRAATYLQRKARLREARDLFQRALAVTAAALGPDHPPIGAIRNSLGLVLRDLGDLQGAKAQLEHALEIDEAALGPDHPNVGRDRSNLGRVLRGLGDLQGAKAQHERALEITEAALGPDHSSVGIRRHNLGMVLKDLGNLQGARAQLERALEIGEAAYGTDHPAVGTVRSNLGTVLEDLGNLQGARAQLERALTIHEAAYGPDHPRVGIDRSNLGRVLGSLGDLQGAKAQLERALEIDEAALGPDHPMTVVVRNNLANVVQALKQR